MNAFRVTFQDPFERKPVEKNLSGDEALADFRMIDWARFNAGIIAGDRDVWEHFYFWEVREAGTDEKVSLLNASGEFTHGTQLQEEGPLLTVTYFVPRQETSRGFLGMGAPRTRTVLDETQMQRCKPAFVEQCVVAFLAHDLDFLQIQIIDRTYDD